ncbi:MAG: metal-dependent transcriptional regulator [Clostridiales bacterium]
MKFNESMEMYLETILLLEENHGHAHGVDIAKKLRVSKPSVTKAMNILKENGFVNKETYGTITLTKKGLEYSKKIYSTHTLISKYLEKSLGLKRIEATKNACKMEHVISTVMLDAIKTYLESEDKDDNY